MGCESLGLRPGHTFLIDLRRQGPCWRLASLPAAGSGWAGVACVCGGLLSNHRVLLRTALAGAAGTAWPPLASRHCLFWAQSCCGGSGPGALPHPLLAGCDSGWAAGSGGGTSRRGGPGRPHILSREWHLSLHWVPSLGPENCRQDPWGWDGTRRNRGSSCSGTFCEPSAGIVRQGATCPAEEHVRSSAGVCSTILPRPQRLPVSPEVPWGGGPGYPAGQAVRAGTRSAVALGGWGGL